MESTGIQIAFFQHLKTQLPPHMTMVDEIAEILGISNDSAYRRIRGEKPIDLEETYKLCNHFRVSMDQLMHLESDAFIFNGKLANESDYSFESWMQTTLQHIVTINSFRHKHMYYMAKDIPIFQQFLVPEITSFKAFLWQKSYLHYDKMKGKKFSLKTIDPVYLDFSNKIAEVYCQIGSTDIWNFETINSTLRQIEFYRDSGVFESPDDVTYLYESVLKLIGHIEKQAEVGLKFPLDGKPSANAGNYMLVNNELLQGNNMVFVEMDDRRLTLLNHSTINYISTVDKKFNAYVEGSVQNLISKSTQLSRVGEKERTRFFNRIRDKIKLAARL